MNIFGRTPLLLLSMLLLALLITACQEPVEPEVQPAASTASPQQQDNPPCTATATVDAPVPAASTPPPAPISEPTSPPQPTAEGEGTLSLAQAGIALDTGSPLFESVRVESVPVLGQIADPGPRDLVQPAHTVLYLAGYPDSENYREPQITIYPVEVYTRLTLAAEQEVERLQALIAAGLPAESVTRPDTYPYLPEPNAAQILHAKAAPLSFANGQGVRYLTQFVQDFSPIVSNSLLYTFQGLTADGQFWVSAVLPVASDALPRDIPEAQEQGFDSFTMNFDRAGYDDYLAQQQGVVDNLPDDAFTPDLAALDALVQSLDLSGYRGPDVEVWAPDVAPGPDQVLDDFLEAYVAAGGFPAGAHRDNAHLHPDFVASLEATVSAYHELGLIADAYDPILMSQLGPAGAGAVGSGFDRLAIGPASIDGNEATVLLERHWHYTNAVSPLRFTFGWSGEQWQLTGASSIVAPLPSAPEERAQELLALMTASAGQFATAEEWLRQLSPDFVVPNATISLCDQSWPVGFAIEGSFIQPAPLYQSSNVQEEAYVVGYLPFSGGVLTMHLVQEDGTWKVSNIVCGDTAQGRALASYAWYLGAASQAAETRWTDRAPQIDAMNPGHFFVTSRFLREARLRFQEDPYLPPARVPDRFVVMPGPQENAVLVQLEYLGETEAELQTLQVTLEREGELWLIDNIELQAAE